MSCKITKTTCPHCGRVLTLGGAVTKHIEVCARRPTRTKLLRLYEELGQVKLVAEALGVSSSTVCRWLRGHRRRDNDIPNYKTDPIICPRCKKTMDPRGYYQHKQACDKLPPYDELVVMCDRQGSIKAVAAELGLHRGAVSRRLKDGEYGWRPPAHVAAAMEGATI